MPWIQKIYEELRRLPFQWEWHCIEGVARNVNCTKWCASQAPGFSNDGTTEFLKAIVNIDERVKHTARPIWNGGKVEMCNHPLKTVREPVLLWQMDADEVFQAKQIDIVRELFLHHPEKNAAYFWCRYFVGDNKVITTRNCFGNHPEYEWQRVWRIKPGMLFRTHEPPVIEGLKLNPFTHAETEARGLVFDHYSWCTRAQVEMKANYYAGPNNPNAKHYAGLVERWETFQNQTVWPRPLKEVFPWVEPHCMVDKI